MEQLTELLSSWGIPGALVGPIVAALTIIIGWFIAKFAAAIVAGAINRTGIGRKAKTTGGNIGKSLAKAFFWVIWLIFIPVSYTHLTLPTTPYV